MKKHLLFSLFGIVTLALCSVPTWAQTSPISETFENLGPYGGYQTETWTGDDGGTWTATDARTDLNINGKAITVRNGELISPNVSGGIGNLTVTTQRQYGGGAGVVDVLVNGTSVGTVPYGTNAETSTIENINVAGNVIVKLVPPGGTSNPDRVAFDDLQWTAYSSTDPLISAIPSSLSGLDYDLGDGPSASQNFEVSGSNLSNDGEITVSADTNFEVSTDNSTFAPSVTLPYTGTSLPNTTVYTRLKDGLSEGNYTEQINVSGGGAPTVYVDVAGSVVAPLAAPSLILSEIADPGDNTNARYVEIYNNGTAAIDFSATTVYLARYANANTTAQSVQLTGILGAGEFYTIAANAADFNTAYGSTADLESGIVNVNGDDSFALYIGGDWDEGGTMFDIYGEIGVDGTGEAWEYEDSRAYRNNTAVTPSTTWNASEWTIEAADVIDLTPGEGEGTPTSVDYIYDGVSWTPENPNGVSTSADNIIVQAGTASFTQDIFVNEITVSSGATLNVEQVLDVRGDVLNDGTIVFKSSASAQGQLAPINLSMVDFLGTGEIVSERYIPARDDNKGAYRFLTTPVTTISSIHYNWQSNAASINDNPMPGYGMFITGSETGADGFDMTPAGAPSMFSFDYVSQEYDSVPNTDIWNLDQGFPYVAYVWGDRSVDILGPDGNDPPATSTTLRAEGDLDPETFTTVSISQVAGNFSLIGNPYQAILDMNSVLANSTNVNTNHYYVWDPNLGTRGAYAVVSLPLGSNPEGSEANQFLQVGQSAFVVTATNGPASITFMQADKAVDETPTDVFRPQNLNAAFLRLQMFSAEAYATGNALSDAFQINFSADGNNAVLLNDALKLPNMDENIGTVNGTEILSIENRALPVEGETIPLFTNQYRTNSYVFSISTEGLPENLHVYLVDNYLDTETMLTPNEITLVNFDVDQSIVESVAPDRFSLFFTENSLSTENFLGKDLVLYPNPVQNDIFFIGNLDGGKASVELYNILGQQVLKFENEVPSNGKISVKTATLEPGMYIVNVIQNGSKKTTKILIE